MVILCQQWFSVLVVATWICNCESSMFEFKLMNEDELNKGLDDDGGQGEESSAQLQENSEQVQESPKQGQDTTNQRQPNPSPTQAPPGVVPAVPDDMEARATAVVNAMMKAMSNAFGGIKSQILDDDDGDQDIEDDEEVNYAQKLINKAREIEELRDLGSWAQLQDDEWD